MKVVRRSGKNNSSNKGYPRGHSCCCSCGLFRSFRSGCGCNSSASSLVWKVSLVVILLAASLHQHHELTVKLVDTPQILQEGLSILADAVAVTSTTRAATVNREDSAMTMIATMLATAGKQRNQKYRRRPGELSPDALSLLDSYNASHSIPQLWNCSTVTSPAAKKLVFVHIYKTAGSSIRDYLTWYGKKCRLNVGIVIGCSNVAASSLVLKNDTYHRDKSGWWNDTETKSPCTLKYRYDQVTKKEYYRGKMGSDVFRKLDIVGGHLPLGVHLHRNIQQHEHHQHQHSGVQYFTFVRDPLQKYISGRFYSNSRYGKQWTPKLAAKTILRELTTFYRQGKHYDKYSTYLLTPMQKEQVQQLLNHSSTTKEGERRLLQKHVDLMQANLVEMNVLVGVVERMNASYRLLQLVMDGSRELDPAFRVLSSKVHNKSKLSFTDILKLMKAMDPDIERKAKEVLKYEYQLYHFAMKLHERQLSSLVLQQ